MPCRGPSPTSWRLLKGLWLDQGRGKLRPWDSSWSGSASRGATACPALGPEPRPRFLSSQKFIPLSGVTCFGPINLLNLPERSGNILLLRKPGVGVGEGQGITLAAAQIRGRGLGAGHPGLPTQGPAAPSLHLQRSSKTPPGPTASWWHLPHPCLFICKMTLITRWPQGCEVHVRESFNPVSGVQ